MADEQTGWFSAIADGGDFLKVILAQLAGTSGFKFLNPHDAIVSSVLRLMLFPDGEEL